VADELIPRNPRLLQNASDRAPRDRITVRHDREPSPAFPVDLAECPVTSLATLRRFIETQAAKSSLNIVAGKAV
jgi:hypothetical protein